MALHGITKAKAKTAPAVKRWSFADAAAIVKREAKPLTYQKLYGGKPK